jgi:plastocyanin
MAEPRTQRSLPVPGWALLLVAIAALIVATAALTATLVAGSGPFGVMSGRIGSMMGGGSYGTAGSFGLSGPGPGSAGMMGGLGTGSAAQPGSGGFVAGTAASPRVVRVYAGPGYAFSPSSISVARGETVTFVVTTMGPTTHEFMVGPADAVASDTPEVGDIGMMQTKSLTYTFDGPGPFAFACHAAGHYEAGMRGTIVVGS